MIDDLRSQFRVLRQQQAGDLEIDIVPLTEQEKPVRLVQRVAPQAMHLVAGDDEYPDTTIGSQRVQVGMLGLVDDDDDAVGVTGRLDSVQEPDGKFAAANDDDFVLDTFHPPDRWAQGIQYGLENCGCGPDRCGEIGRPQENTSEQRAAGRRAQVQSAQDKQAECVIHLGEQVGLCHSRSFRYADARHERQETTREDNDCRPGLPGQLRVKP